jgi:hypothetical protein
MPTRETRGSNPFSDSSSEACGVPINAKISADGSAALFLTLPAARTRLMTARLAFATGLS